MTNDALEEFGKLYHHKFLVMKFLRPIVQDLVARMENHDNSKFEEEEFSALVAAKKDLHSVEFGTPEYDAMREKYAPLFAKHYAKNRHHPEFFENGVEGMTLVDLIEMMIDWKAASLREKDGGNMTKSIHKSGEKFQIHPQLIKILENTAKSYNM